MKAAQRATILHPVWNRRESWHTLSTLSRWQGDRIAGGVELSIQW